MFFLYRSEWSKNIPNQQSSCHQNTTWRNPICLKSATYVAPPLKKLQTTNSQISIESLRDTHTHTHTLVQSLSIKLPEVGSPAGVSDLRKTSSRGSSVRATATEQQQQQPLTTKNRFF
ncbi:hypothetical protein L6452_33580 [Arctium lappa]|uniref:Uncharacterized protein n=1 Tax=Arctium lappa TaxID=4217 RepID=A0ACB8YGF7_ARCLA|nr:hypothetical protein L6452_33580 [Arctium lappa]